MLYSLKAGDKRTDRELFHMRSKIHLKLSKKILVGKGTQYSINPKYSIYTHSYGKPELFYDYMFHKQYNT